MNPVPVPPHLMGTLVSLLQSQGQLHGQVQQAPAAGVAPMQAYQQVQQPAGFGPVFNWPGWQPAQSSMTGGQQQWPAMPQQQPMVHPPPVAPQQASMNDLTAALSAVMRSMQQQERAPSNGPPVGSHPSDEQTLVDALKKGLASGQNPRQVLEKLHRVNGHKETDWKNYFLEHLDRLHSMVYRQRIEASPSRSSARDNAPRSLPKPTYSSSKGRNAATYHRTGGDSSRSPSTQPQTPSDARHSKAVAPRKSAASTAGSANSRGGKLVSEHAGVEVPLLPPHVKPDPPEKPALTERGRIGKFTNEEKIFFIQFLRWRLARDGPIPDQLKLCRALSLEAPHRSSDSWQKHWDTYPQLPGSILAEAANRTDARPRAKAKAGRPVLPTSDEEEGKDTQEEDEDEEDDDDDVNAEVPSDDVYEDVAHSQPRKKRAKRTLVRVTEEDIRDIAMYKLDRLHEWDDSWGRWKDFISERPKRSYSAWMRVMRRKKHEIDELVQELQREQQAEQHASPQRAQTTSPSPVSQDKPSASSPSRTSAANEKATSIPQKRNTESRLAVRSGSPVLKRVKQEPDTQYVSLLSDSD